MSTTSASLLDRLKHNPDNADWNRLIQIYSPLIRHWLAKNGVQKEDCDDISQLVLSTVHEKISGFEHNTRTGAFRAWLKSITINHLRSFWKSNRLRVRGKGGSEFQSVLEEWEDPQSALNQAWEKEHDLHVTRQILQMIQPRFETNTWLVFQRLVLEGKKPKEVAAEFGMSVNAVYIARTRVMKELREEAEGLLDEED